MGIRAETNTMTREQKIQLLKGVPAPSPSAPTPTLDRSQKVQLLKQAGPGFLESVGNSAKFLGEGALKTVATVGEAIDRFTGAPVRKTIGELQEGKSFLDSAVAGLRQVGAPTSQAPTGKDIAAKAGFSTVPANEAPNQREFISPFTGMPIKSSNISPAGAAGLAVDVLADPTNIIGIGTAAKLATKGAKGTAKLAVKSTKPFFPGAAAVGEGIIESAENTAKAIGKAVKPRIAGNFERQTALARKHGIDEALLPDAIKYGPNSMISKSERVKAQGPLGEQMLANHQKGLNQVRDAVDNHVSETIGRGKAPLDEVATGEFIRDRYNSAVDNFFDGIEESYDEVARQFPGIQVSEKGIDQIDKVISSVTAKAKKASETGATPGIRAQGKFALQNINALMERFGQSGGSYQEMLSAMREIGDAAFKRVRPINATDIPPNIQWNRDLYFGIREALLDTAKEAGGSRFVGRIKANNERMTNFFRENEKLVGTLLDEGKGGEKVFQQIVTSGDTTKIRALKSILPPEDLAQLKVSYLDSLKKTDKDGGFSFALLHNRLRNEAKTKRVVNELFEPGELDEYLELVQLGDDFGPPILNPSGTQQSQAFTNLPGTVKATTLNDAVLKILRENAEKKPPLSPNRTFGFSFSPSTDRAIGENIQRNLSPRNMSGRASKVIKNEKQNEELEAIKRRRGK